MLMHKKNKMENGIQNIRLSLCCLRINVKEAGGLANHFGTWNICCAMLTSTAIHINTSAVSKAFIANK